MTELRGSDGLPGQLYFAVDPQAFEVAITEALKRSGGIDATLSIDERLAAAHLGVVKQEQVGDRWSPLVPPDTWETIDDHGFAAHLFMPVERLLRLLAGRLRFLGVVDTFTAGVLLVPLGCDLNEARANFDGQILSRTLDPPMPPDEAVSFPPELSLLTRSQAARCRHLIDVATAGYFELDHAAFEHIAFRLKLNDFQETDRYVMAYLATLHSVTRSLEAGEDVLVTRIL